MTALAQLIELAESTLWQSFIVFLRVGAMMSLLPAFGERSVPARIKLVLAILFTLVVFPAVPLSGSKAGETPLLWFVLSETLNGLLLGAGLRLFVLALQTAGAMAAQVTSLSQLFGANGVEPLPAIGHTLTIAGLALAVMSGLHLHAAEYLIYSYKILPLATFPNGAAMSVWGIDQVSAAFALAFQLAIPFVIVSLLYNLTLGVINRAMPQLMVALVGAPVITAMSLLLLCLSAPLMLSLWLEALSNYFLNPFEGR